MGLFRFERNKVIPTKELIVIKQFQEIADMEESDKYFSYIFHRCDWDSPYASSDDDIRLEKIKEEILDGEEPPEVVLEACNKYLKLQETPSSKLLNSAKKAARSLQEYFETADPSMSDNPGREAKDLMANLTKVGDLLNKFEEWDAIVKKERDKADTRRGVKLNKYNSG